MQTGQTLSQFEDIETNGCVTLRESFQQRSQNRGHDHAATPQSFIMQDVVAHATTKICREVPHYRLPVKLSKTIPVSTAYLSASAT
jgi:hypothetical protein